MTCYVPSKKGNLRKPLLLKGPTWFGSDKTHPDRGHWISTAKVARYQWFPLNLALLEVPARKDGGTNPCRFFPKASLRQDFEETRRNSSKLRAQILLAWKACVVRVEGITNALSFSSSHQLNQRG